MRTPPALRLAPPSPPVIQTCDHHGGCRWWPYTNSRDFEANAALILIVLFCALVCALFLNGIIRCCLRGDHPPRRRARDQQKPALDHVAAAIAAAPALVFSPGMELAGAEAECAICLSEFEEGEGIRVLDKCRHGFHAQCIEKWLVSRFSCPTCRTTCLASPPPPDDAQQPRELP